MATTASIAAVPRMKLGSQGLEVSSQGLGCMGMTPFFGPAKPHDEMVTLIRRAVDLGVTFLDTADVYGPHANEALLGKVLGGEGYMERVELATKFGISFDEGRWGIHGDPAYVRAAIEGSLKRLGVDCVDLYYQHRIDTTLPVEITIGELKKLVEEGKIKYIGLSEASASTIRRAHAVHPITAVQLEWSLWSRDVEAEIVPTCRELGIGIVAYSPLGRGFFSTGPKLVDTFSDQDFRKIGELKRLVEEGKIKYIGLSEASASTIRRAHAVHPITAVQLEWSLWSRDAEADIIPTCRELGIGIVAYSPLGRGFLSYGPKVVDTFAEKDRRKVLPRFEPENVEKNTLIFERVSDMAKRKGCTPSQLALAWVHHQGNDVCPIPGTTKIENLLSNIEALSVKLTPEDMAEIESYEFQDMVQGGRQQPGMATWVDSETPPVSLWNA